MHMANIEDKMDVMYVCHISSKLGQCSWLKSSLVISTGVQLYSNMPIFTQ